MKVYEKINAYLTAKSIATDVLSESTGIPHARLSSLLNGEETLYANELKVICLALNVSPEVFVNATNINN